jgi:hypothetical protein
MNAREREGQLNFELGITRNGLALIIEILHLAKLVTFPSAPAGVQ